MNAALSKFIFLGQLTFLFVSSLGAQVPDYDLNPWIGDGFDEKADRFFKLLAVQTTSIRTSVSSEEGRMVMGLQLSSAISSGKGNMGFIRGKGGIFPVLEGNFWVARNLRLHGTFSGFSSANDLVFFSSYGFAYQSGGDRARGRWAFSFLRSRLEGPEDLFFKSIVMSTGRRINYHNLRLTLGTGIVLYNSGLHISGVDEDSFPKRMEGAVGMFTLRGDTMIASNIEAGLELRLSPKCFSLTLGLYKIL